MKPPPFDYAAPTDLAAALDLLATPDIEAKVLAGGQSLVPMLNLRLARPDLLVDISRLRGLDHLDASDGWLRIGALVTHARLAASPLVRRHWPLVARAAGLVGHHQIRNAGTVGGSLAHADPAAELPAAVLALDAELLIASPGGTRTVAARDFFRGYLETAVGVDEILVEIAVPPPAERYGSALREHARRAGDFAVAGAAVHLVLDGGLRCARASVVLIGAGATPLRAGAAEQLLVGGPVDPNGAAEAAVHGLTPTADLHGSAEYRVHLLRALVEGAVEEAARRAGATANGER
ncbi:FAD binding domain-containing protein [Pseudonocardia sp.]|uniref:FAD binding domain-containing protein n=1 Tax=Pseudonocardia sp. TaxID=60912 RepID=UPI003D0EE69F